LALDPNCRPRLIPDREGYRARLERWVAMMALVKVSSADLAWLYPDLRPAAVAERWLGLGARVVVVTDGGRGAVGFDGANVSRVPTPTVTVADTIGAGDTFNAGLLGWLARHDALDPAALRRLGPDGLGSMLRFAAAAAAVTCSRPGADPPWAAELPR
jgi:fructokinase